MFIDNNKPKMLRQDIKSLENTRCVAAYNTIEAILRKDAIHPTPIENPPSYKDTLIKISDNILDNKYKLIDILDKILKDMMIMTLTKNDEHNETFFNKNSDAMNILSTAAYHSIFSFCDTDPELLNDTASFYHQAKKAIATEMSSLIPIILSNGKEEMTPFLTMATRNTVPNRELNALIIRGANFDNKWHTIINDAIPTAKSGTSTGTLANTLATIQETTEKHQSDIVELDNQITKISIRLGDLKTSELETRFQKVENVFRLHNINSLDIGTPNHFRTLNNTQQTTRIHQFVTEFVSPSVGFSTQIITPKTNTRQFEPLAIITFSDASDKYNFEKSFANYRKDHPNLKITTSRPAPQTTSSDRDMPDEYDIKLRIGMLYNQKVNEARRQNPGIEYEPLNQQEIEAINVKLKTKRRPFGMYWEFLCPSNNTTFMTYTQDTNPFSHYDFTNKIANPLTRKQANIDPNYAKRFPPKIYNIRK